MIAGFFRIAFFLLPSLTFRFLYWLALLSSMCLSGGLFIALWAYLALFDWAKTLETSRQELPQTHLDPVAYEALASRVQNFRDCMRERCGESLVLDAADVAALFEGEAKLAALHGRLTAAPVEDRLLLRTSLPLDFMKLPDKYLNAKVWLRLVYQDGRMKAYINDLEVQGAAIPAWALKLAGIPNLIPGRVKLIPELARGLKDVKIDGSQLIFEAEKDIKGA